MSSPFTASQSKPGQGYITLALLPPATSVLQTLSYQYPLKLISPSPITLQPVAENAASKTIHTVFILTYGGGLVAGDSVILTTSLDPSTRLILLTQGSTKIFKSPTRDITTRQRLSVSIAPGAALCYLPDPVQPFGDSVFEQTQVYELASLAQSSICVCDWVCEGRRAQGEQWAFWRYVSRNEFWLHHAAKAGVEDRPRRLLLRDNLILDDQEGQEIKAKVDGMGVFGTLMLCGHVFERVGAFFMNEFAELPRIGARKWDGETAVEDPNVWRSHRQSQEKRDGLLWTAAAMRGFVVVKFGANEVEGAKKWLWQMLRHEGTVEREFGERALLCLR